MTRILVVEDDPSIRMGLEDTLTAKGYEVDVVGRGTDGVERATSGRYDLVVLDVMLPDIDGFEVCRRIRQSRGPARTLPVIILSARGAELDRVRGLELGADDYVTKPFSPRELVARVRAVLRRVDMQADDGEVLRVGPVTVDQPKMRVTVDGNEVDLTPTEFQIVATLAGQPGRVFTRAQLLDAVHGVAFETYERAIDAHVKNIRRKMEPDPGRPRFVQTVHGVGYRFSDA